MRTLLRVIEFAERVVLLPFQPFFWFLNAVFWGADRTLKSIAEENRDPRVQREVEEMMEWWDTDPIASPNYSLCPGNVSDPED